MTAQVEFVYPPVTDDLLAEMVRCIRLVGDPILIVLFGSRARDDARPDSDIDILIVEESDLPRYKGAPRYLRPGWTLPVKRCCGLDTGRD
jgi:uncharacterized protein